MNRHFHFSVCSGLRQWKDKTVIILREGKKWFLQCEVVPQGTSSSSYNCNKNVWNSNEMFCDKICSKWPNSLFIVSLSWKAKVSWPLFGNLWQNESKSLSGRNFSSFIHLSVCSGSVNHIRWSLRRVSGSKSDFRREESSRTIPEKAPEREGRPLPVGLQHLELAGSVDVAGK